MIAEDFDMLGFASGVGGRTVTWELPFGSEEDSGATSSSEL